MYFRLNLFFTAEFNRKRNCEQTGDVNPKDSKPSSAEGLDEAELERQYQQHKKQFELWKQQNKRLESSATYQNYIKQFEAWEVEVEKRRQLIRNKKAQAEAAKAAAVTTAAGSTAKAANSAASVSGAPLNSNGQSQTAADGSQSGPNADNSSLDPFAFMMGMMSMMFFDPLTMSMMGPDGTPASTEQNNIPSGPISAPNQQMGPPQPQCFGPPTGEGPPPRISHAQAAQQLAMRQRERDWEARAGRTPRFPPPDFFPGPDAPRGPRYPPPEPAPSLGPDYGYGGSRGMWGGHETNLDNEDPMFKRWGHRADPPSKGPGPSSAYSDQRPYDFTEEYPPPYGTILPPGWVTGQPIRRERMLPPPPRDYRGGRPAFRDFSMRSS